MGLILLRCSGSTKDLANRPSTTFRLSQSHRFLWKATRLLADKPDGEVQPKMYVLLALMSDRVLRTEPFGIFLGTYCMPSTGVPLLPKEDLLTTDEIERVAKLFISNGVKKIRLTGGEPTVRKDLIDVVCKYSYLLCSLATILSLNVHQS